MKSVFSKSSTFEIKFRLFINFMVICEEMPIFYFILIENQRKTFGKWDGVKRNQLIREITV